MMAEKMEAKIIAREIVKPSCPTPAHLRRFNLSLADQMVEHRFVPILFFYSANGEMNFQEKCRQLKSSLSRTLSLFYPIAGRLRDHCSIDCCDAGAEFVEAELKCPMTLFLVSSPLPDLVSPLVPVFRDPTKTDFLFRVQATLFDCGGLAICYCITHKIADGVTYMSFIQTWATIARDSDSGRVESPDMGLASLLPPNPDLEPPTSNRNKEGKILTKRLFFSAPKLEELRGRASSSVVGNPTRVEAVLGLIWKCAAAAASSTVQHSALVVAANLREQLVPLVSKNTVGNIVSLLVATTATSDLNISNQVIALRREKEVFKNRLEGVASVEAIKPLLWFEVVGEVLSKVKVDRVYSSSSICGVPINFDFGWGRPRLFIPCIFEKNVVLLTDTEDLRGIQVYVTLEEQEMNYFEKDEDLLSFASFTPPAQFINFPAPKPKL